MSLTRMCLVLVHANTLEIRLAVNTFCLNYGYVMAFPRLWCPRTIRRIGVRYEARGSNILCSTESMQRLAMTSCCTRSILIDSTEWDLVELETCQNRDMWDSLS